MSETQKDDSTSIGLRYIPSAEELGYPKAGVAVSPSAFTPTVTFIGHMNEGERITVHEEDVIRDVSNMQ